MPKVKVFEKMNEETDEEMEKEIEEETRQEGKAKVDFDSIGAIPTPALEEKMGKKVRCKVFRLDGRNDEISVTVNGVRKSFMPGVTVELPEAHVRVLETPYDAYESYEDEKGQVKIRRVTKFRFAIRRE